ncbi:hypothetical protein [Clostridium sp. DL-VIII]|nr:hypothetical protein [Clostridium sp. DL-VIII]
MDLEHKINEKKAAYDREQAYNPNYTDFIRFISKLDKGVYPKNGL